MKFSENFNKEIEIINNRELKTAVTKKKNILQGINSRLQDVAEQINYLEDRIMKTAIQVEKQKEILNKENRLRGIKGNIKHTKLHIIGVSEEERQKWAGNLFEDIIIEKIPNCRQPRTQLEARDQTRL